MDVFSALSSIKRPPDWRLVQNIKPNEILIAKLPSARQQSPLVSMATPIRLPVTSTNKLNASEERSYCYSHNLHQEDYGKMVTEEFTSFISQMFSSLSRSNSSSSSLHDIEKDSWEIVRGLREGVDHVPEPPKHEGEILKKRRWPLKGYNTRYFSLDKGILKYSKCLADLEKGKLRGSIDVGLSVMAIKKKSMRIDLDTEDNIYHLKLKEQDLFDNWVSKLRHHRLYRQKEIAAYEEVVCYPFHWRPNPPSVPDNAPIKKCMSIRRQSTVHTTAASPLTCSSQGKVAAWLHSSEDMDRCSKDISVCEDYLLELSHLQQNMEALHRTYSAPSIQMLQVSAYESPKKEKRLLKKWPVKHNNKDVKTTLQVPSCMPRLHASNPNLSTTLCNDKNEGESLPCGLDVTKLQEDFCRVASNLHSTMKSALSSMTSERERLKQYLDNDTSSPTSQQVVGLKNALAAAVAENSELKERLRKIHSESQIVEDVVVNVSPHVQKQDATAATHDLVQQVSCESRASVAESLYEFFDAQEFLLSTSSSEVSEDESCISDVSDNITTDNLNNEKDADQQNSSSVEEGSLVPVRRSCLPSPSPQINISLWDILRNNIGKELSKVKMPVQFNEPLNTLQRMCEELEYCELLEKAADTPDPFQRMVYIATFVVSIYTFSYYRIGGKPFNPVLGETYECDRPDKGFKFVAEQVSHHPPISACHAEAKDYVFWQDLRCKNKFWGKSMEIFPIGTTNVHLPKFGDHYEWKNVTSCIHNLLSGPRWIEHYGEINIKNNNSDICQCKITFIKSKYWNPRVNEVEAVITDRKGKVIHKLFGKWNEAIYCGEPPLATCVWKANTMPVDYEHHYGFSKFAIELNELEPSLKALLPPTDTRLRLDQRLLEEGNVEAAAEQKKRIEELQRERRKELEEKNLTHQPKFFRKTSDDTWVSNNTYWELRKDPGFSQLDFPKLW
ncbi:oxysterol-binding protein-related protein 3 isoform X2 [Takifugu flavidus]|uniref:oxysterol-binding protein-related protein 3 isoform X2 n=1 Tax=Takifugu flavidus TaxID=433684 RepID=UPI0025449F3C|nr:oxysterol-binding protein-related protein 3 isoform X2 [Takifugu flavidus]